MKVSLLTLLALVAFAGNSVIGRAALSSESIDSASFTLIRLFSGAITLWLILFIKSLFQSNSDSSQTSKGSGRNKGTWLEAVYLFTYAATFSFGYLLLDTATGALILFVSVQLVMIAVNLLQGNRLSLFEWMGMAFAISGFIYLMYPELGSPTFLGFILMALSGMAWGLYTIEGKKACDALSQTTYNFLRTLPFALILFALFYQSIDVSAEGVFWAIVSGSVTSGVGYAIWYRVIQDISTTQAAVFQLAVPVIAAFGGVFWIGEGIGARLLISSILIFTGILLVIFNHRLKQTIIPASHRK